MYGPPPVYGWLCVLYFDGNIIAFFHIHHYSSSLKASIFLKLPFYIQHLSITHYCRFDFLATPPFFNRGGSIYSRLYKSV
jgi:hypothetical protein